MVSTFYTAARALRTAQTNAKTTLDNARAFQEPLRVGPGGAPELLLIGLPGLTELIIPASITFTPGNLYQLWIQARNSRGSSPAGPVQNWTAI